MHLVAIAELKGSIEPPQLNALATEIGTSAYELRLLLNVGLPAVVLTTANPDQARATAEAISRLGHVPVVCDRSQTLRGAEMATLGDFEFGATELIAERGAASRCSYEQITVIIRALHRSLHHSVEQVKERKLRPIMALATAGMVTSKKVTKDVATTTSSREQVLYLFRRGEQHPWILREHLANYAALGSDMAPSSFENFTNTIQRLRKLAPQAIFDERLTSSHPIRGLGDGSDAVDILAYMLADHLGAGRR